MPTSTPTKTDIQFDEFHIRRETRFDFEAGQDVTRWYVTVSYRVLTQEGEVWSRHRTEELTGAFKTKASELLTRVRNYILQQEGL